MHLANPFKPLRRTFWKQYHAITSIPLFVKIVFSTFYFIRFGFFFLRAGIFSRHIYVRSLLFVSGAQLLRDSFQEGIFLFVAVCFCKIFTVCVNFSVKWVWSICEFGFGCEAVHTWDFICKCFTVYMCTKISHNVNSIIKLNIL